jgi:uncharacterized membrane protein (DUF4010 family)
LLGAVAFSVAGAAGLAAATIATAFLAGLAYWRARDDDPGITTEVAVVLTVLVGGYAMREPGAAAAVAVSAAVLLAVRAPLHRFVRDSLNEAELRDALVFASATLIVLRSRPSPSQWRRPPPRRGRR